MGAGRAGDRVLSNFFGFLFRNWIFFNWRKGIQIYLMCAWGESQSDCPEGWVYVKSSNFRLVCMKVLDNELKGSLGRMGLSLKLSHP